MGQLDQLAKDLFAEETESITGGAAIWEAPGEIGLAAVRLDGLLRIRDGSHLTALAGPWAQASGHDEVTIEIKMAGDHLDFRMLNRAELRRQARQVQRIEAPKSRWDGEEPLWVVAPHVPAMLAERRTLTPLEPGCYAVGPYPFSFLWIAANKLPLCDELIPFLIARSGKALEEFVRWVALRRPRSWYSRMVQVLPMSMSFQEEVFRNVPEVDDPGVRARQRALAQMFLRKDPLLEAAAHHEGLEGARAALRRVRARAGLPLSADEEARTDACTDLDTLEHWLNLAIISSVVAGFVREERALKMVELWENVSKDRLMHARAALRRVLARRGLPLSPDDDARIEACTDLDTLQRWLDEAVVAPSAADALH